MHERLADSAKGGLMKREGGERACELSKYPADKQLAASVANSNVPSLAAIGRGLTA